MLYYICIIILGYDLMDKNGIPIIAKKYIYAVTPTGGGGIAIGYVSLTVCLGGSVV